MSKFSEEHSRYEGALKAIINRYPSSADAYRVANAALYPPPPPPVTIEEIQAALREQNKNTALGLHNITIFSDGSGHVSYGDGTGCLFHFETLQQALELLKQ